MGFISGFKRLIYTLVGVIKKWKYNESNGYAVAQLVEALRYKTGSRGFDSRLQFPGTDSASDRNGYQGYFLRD